MNLAGFDVVLELSRGFLEDTFLSTPRGLFPGGNPNDTFAPTFSWPIQITAAGATGSALFIVQQVELVSSPGSTNVQLTFTFADSSLIASFLKSPLSLIAGELDLKGQLGVTADASGNTSLIFNQTSAVVNCNFDMASQDQMNSQIPGLATLLRTAVENQFQQQIRSAAVSPALATLPFTVNGSMDSEDPTVVTAIPVLRWIDAETLGFFGLYRRVSPGDPALKTDSDLIPFERSTVSVLLSPEDFHQVYGCPAVRKYVRDTVGEPIYEGYLAEEKAKTGNTGNATQAQIDAANGRLSDFFKHPDGQHLLADQTPPPCGSGSTTQHVNPPNPFPGTDAHVREISVGLEPGKIQVHFQADAEIFCGKVDVSQTIHFPIAVKGGAVTVGTPEKDTPSTNISGNILCKAALGAVGVAVAGLTGGLTGFLALAWVDSFLEDPIGKKISDINFTPNVSSPDTGLPVSWRGIICDHTGLLLAGRIYVSVSDPQPFNPTVSITVSQKAHNPIVQPFPDAETDQLTGVACIPPPGTTFHYSRGVTDWENTLGLQSQDVPLPLTVGAWYVQFGYRTKSYGYLTVQYDTTKYPLSPGPLFVTGVVWDPEPPLDGALVENVIIHLNVAAAAGPGFILNTTQGDMNYFMLVTTTVIDATNNVWHPAAQVAIDGKKIILGDDITQFIKDCDKKLAALNDRFAKSHRVAPWQQRIDIGERVREDLLAGLRDGAVGITSALNYASAKIGEKTVYNLIVGNKGKVCEQLRSCPVRSVTDQQRGAIPAAGDVAEEGPLDAGWLHKCVSTRDRVLG